MIINLLSEEEEEKGDEIEACDIGDGDYSHSRKRKRKTCTARKDYLPSIKRKKRLFLKDFCMQYFHGSSGSSSISSGYIYKVCEFLHNSISKLKVWDKKLGRERKVEEVVFYWEERDSIIDFKNGEFAVFTALHFKNICSMDSFLFDESIYYVMNIMKKTLPRQGITEIATFKLLHKECNNFKKFEWEFRYYFTPFVCKNHFYVVVIDLWFGKIWVYDSFPHQQHYSHYPQGVMKVRENLKHQVSDFIQRSTTDGPFPKKVGDWKNKRIFKDYRDGEKQPDGSSCGVFIVWYMLKLIAADYVDKPSVGLNSQLLTIPFENCSRDSNSTLLGESQTTALERVSLARFNILQHVVTYNLF